MPATPHIEQHFTGSEAVRDVVIGMADGLTVPFALAAGLTAAVTSSHVIVTAGLAEVAAGAIAMGLGGYLAARSDQEHYASEERREHHETEKLREVELRETADIFRGYGLEGAALEQVTRAIASDPKRWVDFMMRFELDKRIYNSDLLCDRRPDPAHAVYSRSAVAASSDLLSRVYRNSPCYLRRRQGKAHRNQHAEVGSSNGAGRRVGRGRRLLFGLAVRRIGEPALIIFLRPLLALCHE